MFKKLFLGGSTLLLALGLVFGATPVFAQRATDPTSNVPMPPPMLATITSMAARQNLYKSTRGKFDVWFLLRRALRGIPRLTCSPQA